jgi:hypothetical protein
MNHPSKRTMYPLFCISSLSTTLNECYVLGQWSVHIDTQITHMANFLPHVTQISLCLSCGASL